MFSVNLFVLIHKSHWVSNIGYNFTYWAKVFVTSRLLLAFISVFSENNLKLEIASVGLKHIVAAAQQTVPL